MRFLPWFHHWRSPDPQLPRALPSRGDELADEVEAFLAGRLVEHFAVRGHQVPLWAVLSKLTHATIPELVGILEGDPRSRPYTDAASSERDVGSYGAESHRAESC